MEERRHGTKRIDQVVGGGSIVMGVVLTVASWRLGLGVWREPGPGAWPFLLSLALTLFGSWLFFRPDPSVTVAAKLEPRWGRLVLALLSMVGYVVSMVPLGYLVSMFLLLLVQLRWVEGRRWGGSALAGLLSAIISFIVFGLWLKVPLPAGIIPIRAG